MPIKYDENGNPLPPTQWDDQPSFDPASDAMLAKTTSTDVAQAEDYAANPQQSPFQMTPQKYLKEAFGIGTTGPKADQFAQQAQDYKANQAETFDKLGQNMPQQFGTAETVDHSEEGPLTPQETAAAMPTNKTSMDELIKKHLLPANPRLSRDGYANNQTANEEAQKAERQLRGQRNRADAASKDAHAMDQTIALNGLQGAGPAAGGGQSSFGGGNRVSNIGGYTFVRGQWRPQDTNEAAHSNLLNSQARYADSRPDLEASKQQALNDRLGDRLGYDRDRDQLKGNLDAIKQQAKTDKDQQKLALQARSRFDELVKQVREMEGNAKQQASDATHWYNWNNADPQQYLDSVPNPDRRSKEKFVKKPGAFQSAVEDLVRMNDTLHDLHDKGYESGTVDPEVVDMISRLRQYKPKGAQ